MPGITREIIIDCANHCGIDLKEVAFDKEALMNADEVWISSSTREVFPITNIDDQQINSGQVGPIWSLIYNQYQALKEKNLTL